MPPVPASQPRFHPQNRHPPPHPLSFAPRSAIIHLSGKTGDLGVYGNLPKGGKQMELNRILLVLPPFVFALVVILMA